MTRRRARPQKRANILVHLRQLPNDGFVEISFDRGESTHSAALSFSLDGGATYAPCALYPDRNPEALLTYTTWEWDDACRFGKVRLDDRLHPVYWNLYLNGLHHHRGPVSLRVETLHDSGPATHDLQLGLAPSRAIYLDDWPRWADPDSGWQTESGRLTVADYAKAEQPFRIRPGVEGEFLVALGLRRGGVNARLRVSDDLPRYPFACGEPHSSYEVPWKQVRLRPDSELEIWTTAYTRRHADRALFGAISYIKLTPASRRRTHRPRWPDKKLALYFEPYSVAFVYDLDTPSEIREFLSIFREMGADEIHTQSLRFGSRSLHHGRIAEWVGGQTAGDDGTLSPGPARMVAALDALRESIDICHDLGMTHYANAGITICYPGTDLEDRFSREHPEWREGQFLRYCYPETRAYAAGIVREFVEWGTDGVTIDCMRYPEVHTEADLLALFGEIHRAIEETRGEHRVPLTVRIPVGDIMYYRAFERLAREGVVDCVVASSSSGEGRMYSLHPYLEWHRYGCRIYGCVDWWGTHPHGPAARRPSIAGLRDDIAAVLKQGADGIYIYQADGALADPFRRTALDWRK